MPQELDAIAIALKNNNLVEPVKVRDFLDWFGAKRRGVRVVREIRDQLDALQIKTNPDFEGEWIEALIDFRLTHPSGGGIPEEGVVQMGDEETSNQTDSTPGAKESTRWVSLDPTYRISKLGAANSEVVHVKPDEPISNAVTLMLQYDYSQLPVMTGREVRGVISWKSIGSRLALGASPQYVREAIEQQYEVRASASIFDVIGLIVQHGYVLVRSQNQSISGIVTASDLSLQFQTLTEPFLVLSEIENLLRNMIGSEFTPQELSSACDPHMGRPQVASVSDLTFGEYIRLLEYPARWARLNLQIGRELFCKNLDEVRRIRNDVMHFDPDGIPTEDLTKLQRFQQFMKQLAEIRVPLL